MEGVRMWWELALNPRVVSAYYSNPPDLRGVEIHSLRLYRDSSTMELIVELPRFPDRPSPRWPSESNTAQATLSFIALRNVAIDGWGTTNIGDLYIEKFSGGIQFRFECVTTRIHGIAEWFNIVGISSYVKDIDESDTSERG